MKSRTCPGCGLINPESAGRCDCGYVFDPDLLKPIPKEPISNTPSQVPSHGVTIAATAVHEGWYIGLDGQKQGPVRKDELELMLERGTIPAETLVWSKLLSDWTPAERVLELNWRKPDGPPPLPTQSPAPRACSNVSGTPDLSPQPPLPGLGNPQWQGSPGYYPPPQINVTLPSQLTHHGKVILEGVDKSSKGRLMKVIAKVIMGIAAAAFGFGFYLQSQGQRSETEVVIRVAFFLLIPGVALHLWGAIYEYIYRRDR
jgi:hypothetical protein